MFILNKLKLKSSLHDCRLVCVGGHYISFSCFSEKFHNLISTEVLRIHSDNRWLGFLIRDGIQMSANELHVVQIRDVCSKITKKDAIHIHDDDS